MADEKEFHCAVCFMVFFDPVSLDCAHTFCRECIVEVSSKAIISLTLILTTTTY